MVLQHESFYVTRMCVHAHSSCVRLFVTPWTAACQAPLSMGFSPKNIHVNAISSSRGSSQLRDWTHVSCTGRQILYHSVSPGKPQGTHNRLINQTTAREPPPNLWKSFKNTAVVFFKRTVIQLVPNYLPTGVPKGGMSWPLCFRSLKFPFVVNWSWFNLDHP